MGASRLRRSYYCCAFSDNSPHQRWSSCLQVRADECQKIQFKQEMYTRVYICSCGINRAPSAVPGVCAVLNDVARGIREHVQIIRYQYINVEQLQYPYTVGAYFVAP